MPHGRAMATVTFEDVSKTYPDGTRAVSHLSLDVADGEFVVMVGPSGCGKSTTLRMLAGLEDVTSGKVRIGDDVVNDWLPKQRDISMVFQTHALYPHMSVQENLGFAMRVQRAPEPEARRRIRRTADMLAIGGLLHRRPRTLSVGERQRVAMGRAVVRQPRVFLMDEPLSSLDAGLRVQTRSEILALQRRLGVTTIYVTHDQVEAMTMGDRVAVMADGAVLQCAAPQQLYDLPANVFVAAFLGTPAMNLFRSELLTDADGERWVRFGAGYLALDPQSVRAHSGIRRRPDGPIVVGMRPESLSIAPHDAARNVVPATVTAVEMLGSESLAYFTAPGVEVVRGTDRTNPPGGAPVPRPPRTGIDSAMCARLSPPIRFGGGTPLRLSVDTRKLLFFDVDGRIVA
jgi:multiple sugar transport system ATP-binding protein